MTTNCKFEIISSKYKTRLIEFWYVEIGSNHNWNILGGPNLGPVQINQQTQLTFRIITYQHLPRGAETRLYIDHQNLQTHPPTRIRYWEGSTTPTLQNAIPGVGTQLPADLSPQSLIHWYYSANGPARIIANRVDCAQQEVKINRE